MYWFLPFLRRALDSFCTKNREAPWRESVQKQSFFSRTSQKCRFSCTRSCYPSLAFLLTEKKKHINWRKNEKEDKGVKIENPYATYRQSIAAESARKQSGKKSPGNSRKREKMRSNSVCLYRFRLSTRTIEVRENMRLNSTFQTQKISETDSKLGIWEMLSGHQIRRLAIMLQDKPAKAAGEAASQAPTTASF